MIAVLCTQVGDDAAREKVGDILMWWPLWQSDEIVGHSNTAFVQVGQLLREALTKRDPEKDRARKERRRARTERARETSSSEQIPQELLRDNWPGQAQHSLFDDIDPIDISNPESEDSYFHAAGPKSKKPR